MALKTAKVSMENEGPILYDHLMQVCEEKLKAQREFLKKNIDTIENSDAWKEIINFEEFCIVDENIGLRQDSCIDKTTKIELIRYPCKPQFSGKELKSVSKGLKNLYEANGYLSDLVIIFVHIF